MAADYKKSKASAQTITRNTHKMSEKTDNLYEAVVVISKRSHQIAKEMKEELDRKLAEFASTSDNLEEIFENREQIEISRFYEGLPKSSAIAIQEFEDDAIYFRKPEKS